MTYFILGGAMRSGTTLLNNIVCGAEGVNPHISEPFLLTHLTSLYANMRNNFSASLYSYFNTKGDFTNLTHSWIESFFAEVKKKYGCSHLVLKTPEITPLIPDLFELLGDKARFVVMVRDPRDTVLSMLHVAERLKQRGITHNMVNFGRDIAAFANLYNSYYAGLFNRLSPELKSRSFFLRYEDLAANPQPIIKALENFMHLKINYDPSVNWRNFDDKGFEKALENPLVESFNSKLYRKPLSDKSIGKYRQELTQSEIETINKSCLGMMQLFQYNVL